MLRTKQLRLYVLAGAALLCACLGFGGTVLAQQATYKPLEPQPKEVPANTGKFAPLDWTPAKGAHPGEKTFKTICSTCHILSEKQKVGPGLLGISDRVPERERLLHFITEPKATDGDSYFKALRGKFSDAMPAQGKDGVKDKGALSEQEILDVIDFIFRFKAEFGPPPEERITLGRALASGEKGFENGAPSCTGCHTIGADKNLRGANLGPNIAHTWVIAKNKEGLQELLAGEKSSPIHHFYGKDQKSITEDEYDSLITFFERAARDTGTETQSNYLPIFALILAALGIFVLDGSLFGKLFVEETEEYVDGPYAPEDHGHGAGHGDGHAAH